jgi:hypothetical protein
MHQLISKAAIRFAAGDHVTSDDRLAAGAGAVTTRRGEAFDLMERAMRHARDGAVSADAAESLATTL